MEAAFFRIWPPRKLLADPGLSKKAVEAKGSPLIFRVRLPACPKKGNAQPENVTMPSLSVAASIFQKYGAAGTYLRKCSGRKLLTTTLGLDFGSDIGVESSPSI